MIVRRQFVTDERDTRQRVLNRPPADQKVCSCFTIDVLFCVGSRQSRSSRRGRIRTGCFTETETQVTFTYCVSRTTMMFRGRVAVDVGCLATSS